MGRSTDTGPSTDGTTPVYPAVTGAGRGAGGVLLGLVLATMVLAGCSSTPSAAPTTTTTTTGNTTSSATAPSTTTSPPASSSTTESAAAPCTQQAISAAAAETPSVGPVLAVTGLACSGSWAYANVTVGTSVATSVDAVIVFQVAGASWVVADRATACSSHLVPAAIYTPACTTS